jgi:ribosomal protein L40E
VERSACAYPKANLLLSGMQQIPVCTSCGAEIPSGARFCRICGQRSTQFNSGSVTEGTTRLLDTPEPNAPFGQNAYEHHGSLAQPTSRILPEANPTSRSLETNPRPQNWALIGTIVAATIALILTALFITLRNRSETTPSPPAVTRPGVQPIQIPPPPAPPRGLPQGNTGSISREFVYPGAETTMEVTDVSEGSVLQLQTSDSLDQVVSWYTEKLKPTKVMRATIPSPSVILEAGEMKAIINTDGGKTVIMLAQGED